jgi:hypothetical protein
MGTQNSKIKKNQNNQSFLLSYDTDNKSRKKLLCIEKGREILYKNKRFHILETTRKGRNFLYLRGNYDYLIKQDDNIYANGIPVGIF